MEHVDSGSAERAKPGRTSQEEIAIELCFERRSNISRGGRPHREVHAERLSGEGCFIR